MTREEAYDAEIAPLMEKIAEIAKKNDIAMFATFNITDREFDSDDEHPVDCVTSIVPSKGSGLSPRDVFEIAMECRAET